MKDKVIAIDIDLTSVKGSKTAYYRLPKAVKEFFDLCHEKDGIIGFRYEYGSYNFGIVLGGKVTERNGQGGKYA